METYRVPKMLFHKQTIYTRQIPVLKESRERERRVSTILTFYVFQKETEREEEGGWERGRERISSTFWFTLQRPVIVKARSGWSPKLRPALLSGDSGTRAITAASHGAHEQEPGLEEKCLELSPRDFRKGSRCPKQPFNLLHYNPSA